MTSSETNNFQHFLTNKLEDLVIHEAVNYYDHFDTNSTAISEEIIDLAHASDYFDKIIPGQVYDYFEVEAYEWFRRMPAEKIGKYLQGSISHLKANAPHKRVDALYEKYIKAYFPDISSETDLSLSNGDKRFMNVVLDKYNVHFGKFRKLIQELLNDYKAGKLNTCAHIFKSKPIDPDEESHIAKIFERGRANILENSRSIWSNNAMTLDLWKQSGQYYTLSKLFDDGLPMLNRKKREMELVTRLYREYVDELFNERYKDPFEDIVEHKKRQIALEGIKVISDLRAGDIDDELVEKLCRYYYIEDWDKARNQIGLIERRRINKEINCDIHSPDCFANTEALLKYEDFLKEYLKVTVEPPVVHPGNDRIIDPVGQNPGSANFAGEKNTSSLPAIKNNINGNGLKTVIPFNQKILHPEATRIAALLKDKFRNKKGKSVRIMLEVLKDNNPPLLNYENRQRKELYKSMKEYFDWDIGSYQSIWDIKTFDAADYGAVKLIVTSVLASVSQNEH